MKNLKNANSNLDFRNKEQKNKLLERIRVLNSFRKKIFLYYNDDIDYYVLRNIRFDIMNNKSYICDILAISKTNKSDIICDVKFYSHLENHLYNLVEKYNSVIQKYYSMHKRTCIIRLVFIVKNDEFNNIDSTEINSKIKVLCGTSGIIAEFHNENELMEV